MVTHAAKRSGQSSPADKLSINSESDKIVIFLSASCRHPTGTVQRIQFNPPMFHFSPLQTPLRIGSLAIAVALTACAVGPDYQRPQPLRDGSAPAFSDSKAWKPAEPGQAGLNPDWWSRYQDPLLDQLLAQCMEANASLAQAQAVYLQTAALVPAAQAGAGPTVAASGGVSRSEAYSQGASSVNTNHSWSVAASWEPDFWGRVGRSVELAGANAQAAAGDLAYARLVLQTTLVNDYLQLRLSDRQLDLYDRLIAGYAKALQIVQAQKQNGLATQADIAQATSTLNATQALAEDLQLTRTQLNHAIAVLVGKLPAQFSVARQAADSPLPVLPLIPTTLPSQLLERRPDIAAAERRVAAANANIGVQKAAWFPNLTLAASYGNAGPSFGNWIQTPYEAWALGATLAATLWDGGLRDAQSKQVQAAFDAAAANYRQVVLNGFQEVEDNLSAIDQLQREINFQQTAATAADTAADVLLRQYRAGTAPYTSVVTAQATALNAQRTLLQLQSRLLVASATLMKALGGGWQSTTAFSSAPTPSTQSTPPAPRTPL